MRNKNPKNILEILKSYFKNRKAVLKLGNLGVIKNVTKSTSQDSALGPLLWNILYDSLLDLEFPSNFDLMRYANDTQCMCFGDTVESIEIAAKNALKIINNLAKAAKINFNIKKTQAMLITRKTKYKKPEMKLNNFKIQLVDKIKYLGVYIDKDLSWNKHFD